MVSFWRNPTTKDAYRLSIASLIIELLATIFGIALYAKHGSALCLVYGLENLVDFLSSAVVLWRFFAPSNLNDEVESRLRRREKRASIAISFILVILGFSVILAALDDLAQGQEAQEALKVLVGISFFSFVVFSIMAFIKFRFANMLESASLYKDGICTLIGVVLSGALFVNTLIIENQPDAWFIDPLISLGAGVVASAIGAQAIIAARTRDQLPIFTMAWWVTSQGDGMDERTGRPLTHDDYGNMNSTDIELPGKEDHTERDDENDLV